MRKNFYMKIMKILIESKKEEEDVTIFAGDYRFTLFIH